MTLPSHFRPSERSIWLAELAGALDQARAVLARLTAQGTEAHHLHSRIAALQSEVDRLRRGRFAREASKDAPPKRSPSWRS